MSPQTTPDRNQPLATLQSRGAHGDSARAAESRSFAPWFHNLHLPDGTQTAPDHPLGDFPGFKWEALAPALPEDLSGCHALDIGCNAGFYSLELARRGARVTAIDQNPHYLKQARWAAEQFGEERITFHQMEVYDLAAVEEQFDVVLFLGVFYHLRYPLLALDLVARRARDILVFQSLSIPEADVPGTLRQDHPPQNLPFDELRQLAAPDWPHMAFVENELAGDMTNWWVPDHACTKAMLRSSGLIVERQLGGDIYLCRQGKEAPRTDGELDTVLAACAKTSPPKMGGGTFLSPFSTQPH